MGSRGAVLLLAAVAAAVAVPAAAQDDPPAQALFISPAGKPYRGPLDKPYPVAAWFAAANAAHDGKLTKAEFRADAEAFFRELDVNKRGYLGTHEIAYYEKAIAPEIVGAVTPYREGADLGSSVSKAEETPQGAAWFSFLGEPEPVTDTDANFDGKITLAEFLKAADERFALLDVDKKGYLTLDKLPQTPVQAKLYRGRKRR